MYIIGIWIKSSVTSAIYRKSLTISSAGKKDTTTGEVVNLMSVDTQRVVDMMVRMTYLILARFTHSRMFFPSFECLPRNLWSSDEFPSTW